MVQTEIAEHASEAKGWREELASRREELLKYQKDLLGIANKRLSREDLKDLEHYQNTFYIQLINIHDVKKDLKQYENVLNASAAPQEEVDAKHDSFKEGYNNLVHVLDSLKNEFEAFMKKPH